MEGQCTASENRPRIPKAGESLISIAGSRQAEGAEHPGSFLPSESAPCSRACGKVNERQ